MDILNQAFNFKILCTTLFLLCLLSYSVSSSSSSSPSSSSSSSSSSLSSIQEIKPQNQNINPSSTIAATATHYHQVFYLKNTDPAMFTRRQERLKKRMRRLNRNRNMKQRKKKMMIKNQQSRVFSVMLPKGFVPPSGSSPCHNDQPDSVSFHCHLTDTTTKP